MDQIELDGKKLRADRIPLPNSALLVIQAEKGMLGCGYLSVETADKLGHALAIVTGVACYDDMLNASVVRVSSAAAVLGVTVGMTGRDALRRMNS